MSNRAERLVSRTVSTTWPGSSVTRSPGSCGPPTSPSTVTVPAPSNLRIADASAPESTLTSAATARNTLSGATPCATSVATRRSAACSSVSCSRSFARLGVGDGAGHQLGELRKTRLGLRRQGLVPGRKRDHRAPEPARDDDRGGHDNAKRQRAHPLRGDAGHGRSVDTCRSHRPEDAAGEGVVLQCNARADRHDAFEAAPTSRDDCAVGRVIPQHPRLFGAEHLADLLSDRREDLGARRFARDERGDAPQGGVLFGEPLHLGVDTVARGRVHCGSVAGGSPSRAREPPGRAPESRDP